MSVFKCKMCGGALEVHENETVAECEYCGTKQTLPRLDNEKRVNLYDRANHFRRNNEFDKAMDIYEQILNEETTDAEAYWSLVLCRYGIEYVEDPASHRRVPTVNRAQFTSVFDDDNYKSALQYADGYQKVIYEEEAKAINEIQKGILIISQKEEPFDVFICYKETDNNGRRTRDSVLANELYHQLTQEGFKVFFARITLEDKLGSAYEPYIFAALNSAKVMVVIGTKPEFFNAVWVRNEWSRYLALIKNGAEKVLIPAYRDMDPYDLPEEFSHLQAQDMSKLGFMQDLIRGIKKIAKSEEANGKAYKETATADGTKTAPLLKRVFLFLEDGNWSEADEYCERILDLDPECAVAYLGKLMAELQIHHEEELVQCVEPFWEKNNYQKAVRFADTSLSKVLKGYVLQHQNTHKEKQYKVAVQMMEDDSDIDSLVKAADIFKEIEYYKNSAVLAEECLKKVENKRTLIMEKDYKDAVRMMEDDSDIDSLVKAANVFKEIESYKNSGNLLRECFEKIYRSVKVAILECRQEAEECYKETECSMAVRLELGRVASKYESVIIQLQTIAGWKDTDELLATCQREYERLLTKRRAMQLESEAKNKERNVKKGLDKKYILFFGFWVMLLIIKIILEIN